MVTRPGLWRNKTLGITYGIALILWLVIIEGA
jgi:hypothetical protein